MLQGCSTTAYYANFTDHSGAPLLGAQRVPATCLGGFHATNPYYNPLAADFASYANHATFDQSTNGMSDEAWSKCPNIKAEPDTTSRNVSRNNAFRTAARLPRCSTMPYRTGPGTNREFLIYSKCIITAPVKYCKIFISPLIN